MFTLHASGFFLGYFVSKSFGTTDKVSRTNSIEVMLCTANSAMLSCKLISEWVSLVELMLIASRGLWNGNLQLTNVMMLSTCSAKCC